LAQIADTANGQFRRTNPIRRTNLSAACPARVWPGAGAQIGGSDGVEFVFDTQRPEKLNPSVVGAATEIVCFRLDERQALKAVGALGHDPEAVKAQPFGSFISRDLKGGELRGRVF